MLNILGRVNGSQTALPVFDDSLKTLERYWSDVFNRTSGSQTARSIIKNTNGGKFVDWSNTTVQNAHLWLIYGHDRKSKIDARIQEFFSYGKNWDGDGAREIPSSAIYQALNFLNKFRSRFFGKEPSSVAPSPDGEIVLYWCNLAGYAEINFNGNGKLSMCFDFESDEMQLIEEDFQTTDNNFNTSRIWQALSNFLGQHDREQENRM